MLIPGVVMLSPFLDFESIVDVPFRKRHAVIFSQGPCLDLTKEYDQEISDKGILRISSCDKIHLSDDQVKIFIGDIPAPGPPFAEELAVDLRQCDLMV